MRNLDASRHGPAKVAPSEAILQRPITGLLLFGGLSLLAAGIGARVGARPRNKLWYRLLHKSKLTPKDRVFGLVWPALYSLSALSAWRVLRGAPSPTRTRALSLWGAQLGCNAAWSPLFFGAHRPRAALIDLSANAAALAGYARYARDVDRAAAWMVAPYLVWLGFAGLLNAEVVAKNRGATRWLAAG